MTFIEKSNVYGNFSIFMLVLEIIVKSKSTKNKGDIALSHLSSIRPLYCIFDKEIKKD